MSSSTDEQTDNDDGLVTVHEALSEFEARSIVVVLEDAGVRAFVFMLADLPLPPSIVGGPRRIPVQVARHDAARARTALERLPRDVEAIDWDDVDVGEITDEVRAAARIGSLSSYASQSRSWPFLVVMVLVGVTLCIVGAFIVVFVLWTSSS